MAKCTLCDLFETSTAGNCSAVKIDGVGNREADIMLVGEAPGADEVRAKKPFQGRAGQELRKYMQSLGLSEENTFITNVCRCRPPENRKPKPKEIKACLPYLKEEVEEIQPKVIALLGATACKAFGVSGKITSIRGSRIWSEDHECWLVPMYHPSYVMRFMNHAPQRVEFLQDLESLKKLALTEEVKYNVQYKVADTVEKARKAAAFLMAQKEFSFDCETTSFDPLKADVVLVTFSHEPGKSILIPYQHPKVFDEAEQDEVQEILKEIFQSKALKIAQNGKFDIKHLKAHGIEVRRFAFDTMLAHHLIDEDGLHNLDVLSQIYTDVRGYKDMLKGYFQNTDENGINNILEAPLETLYEYAAKDSDVTLRVKHALHDALVEEGLDDLFYHVVMPLSYVLAQMEFKGISVDKKYIDKVTLTFGAKIKGFERTLQEDRYVKKYKEWSYEKRLAEKKPRSRNKIEIEPFNFNSCTQLRKLLFDIMEIKPIKYTKPSKTAPKGNPSTDAETLETLAKTTRYELLDSLLKYRKAKKMLEYVVKYKELSEGSIDGCLHTRYTQSRTATGRLASSEPNLQNIPSKDRDPDNAALVRNCFIARPGKTLIEVDYSQMEFRIWADNSDDREMIKLINNDDEDFDIHKYVASRIFSVDYENVTKLQRSLAKGVVYGLMYGRGIWSIAQEFGISTQEAERVQFGFNKLFPCATDWMEDRVKVLRENGYVTNMFGRKRRLPDIFSNDSERIARAERQAKNFPIQSASADIVFQAMIKLYREFMNTDVDMLLMVHDSVIFEVPDEKLERTCVKIKDIMENVVKLKVPMPVDFKVGKKLGEMEKFEYNKSAA